MKWMLVLSLCVAVGCSVESGRPSEPPDQEVRKQDARPVKIKEPVVREKPSTPSTPEREARLARSEDSSLSLDEMFRRAYEEKYRNPEYLKNKRLSMFEKAYQAFPEEAKIKEIRSRMAATISPPPGTKPVSISLRRDGAPTIDGVIRPGEWDGASSVRFAGEETKLLLTATSTKLYIACDAPGQKRKGSGQFRIYLHVDISPFLAHERVHLGLRIPPNKLTFRMTRAMWEFSPNAPPEERWKHNPGLDYRIYNAARGLTKLNPHRQYELELDIREAGLHAGVPFPAFVMVQTASTYVNKKLKNRGYLGQLGSQKKPVWFVIESE